MTLTELLKCPRCGYMYSGKNTRVFGHYRVYIKKEYSHKLKCYRNERIILRCKKCGTEFIIRTTTTDTNTRLIMDKV